MMFPLTHKNVSHHFGKPKISQIIDSLRAFKANAKVFDECLFAMTLTKDPIFREYFLEPDVLIAEINNGFTKKNSSTIIVFQILQKLKHDGTMIVWYDKE